MVPTTASGAAASGPLAVIADLKAAKFTTERRDILLANPTALPVLVCEALENHQSGGRRVLLETVGEIADSPDDLARILEAAGAEAPELVKALIMEDSRVLLDRQEAGGKGEKAGADMNEKVAARACDLIIAIAGLADKGSVENILKHVGPLVFAATFNLMGLQIPAAAGLDIATTAIITPADLLTGSETMDDGTDDERADGPIGDFEAAGRADRSTIADAIHSLFEQDEMLYRRILMGMLAIQDGKIDPRDVLMAHVDEYRAEVAKKVAERTAPTTVGGRAAIAIVAAQQQAAETGERAEWLNIVEEQDFDAENGLTETAAKPAKRSISDID